MDTRTYRNHAEANSDNTENLLSKIAEDSLSEGEVCDKDEKDTESVQSVHRENKAPRSGGYEWRQVAEESAASSLVDRLTVGETSEQEQTRGVEAYNFKAKFADPRPDPELPDIAESEALLRLRKENVGVRDRLGKRRREPESNLEVDIELARIERAKILEKGDPEQIAFTKELAKRLEETNLVLLAHAVSLLGIEHCRRLLQMTETVEEAGGMLTRDGSRRRSAGGVFLQLVKEDKSLSKAQVRSLFQPHQALIKRKCKRMRILRKAHEALDKLEKALE